VVDELHRDPNKKFIYVEMAFFFKWWKEQDEKTKKIVEGLVQNGLVFFLTNFVTH
jgi:lysosomal alpha-mannosidase